MKAAIACVVALAVAAAHAEDAKRCRYVKLATLNTMAGAAVPIVEGAINGKPAKMMLDSGAWVSALTRSGVERLGLSMGHKSGMAVGTGGASELYRAWVEEIAVGPVKGKAGAFVVLWETGASRVDAMMGADFMFQHDIELALADMRVSFFHPMDCDDAPLAYWDRNAPYVTLAPISEKDRRPVVTVFVNGQLLRALVDSGSSSSVIDLPAAARLGITPESKGVVPLGEVRGVAKHTVRAWIATFDRFAIGDEAIDHPRITIADLWAAAIEDIGNPRFTWTRGDEPNMILGADFLRTHRVLFAPSQGRFYFSYLGGKVFDPAR